MRIQFSGINFTPLITRIAELDNDPEQYIAMLKQPWFINNELPANISLKNRWLEIFESKHA
jgi:hypothetical protein